MSYLSHDKSCVCCECEDASEETSYREIAKAKDRYQQNKQECQKQLAQKEVIKQAKLECYIKFKTALEIIALTGTGETQRIAESVLETSKEK